MDNVKMRELYNFAYQRASQGYDWAKTLPGLDPTEPIQPAPQREPKESKAR